MGILIRLRLFDSVQPWFNPVPEPGTMGVMALSGSHKRQKAEKQV